MKQCARCGKEKQLTEFSKKGNGLQTYCKSCNRIQKKLWYQRNKKEERKRLCEYKSKRTIENRKYVVDFLLTHPCVDCEESDIRCLDFDHTHGDKDNNISTMIKGGYSLNRLIEEIDKCDVRCSNCHRKSTSIKGNFWKELYNVGIYRCRWNAH